MNEVKTKTENGLTTTPNSLIELAIRNNAPIESLEKLMDLQDRWEKKQARKSFLDAMSDFQSKIPVITKTQKVAFGQTKYSFAPLGEIADQIKSVLRECGLSYRWEIEEKEKELSVTCIVSHCDGHSEKTTMSGAKDSSGSKNDIQQRGSTITYLKRYTLTGALGISSAEDDSDGKQAQKPALTPQSKNWGATVKKLAQEQVSIKVVEEHFSLSKEHREQLTNEALNLQKA